MEKESKAIFKEKSLHAWKEQNNLYAWKGQNSLAPEKSTKKKRFEILFPVFKLLQKRKHVNLDSYPSLKLNSCPC